MSQAEAQCRGIARRVVRTQRPVTIATPAGMVQWIPWDSPPVVETSGPGTVLMTDEEIRLARAVGECLGDERP